MATTNVVLAENLTVNESGELELAAWSVPILAHDVMVLSAADGYIATEIPAPGKLLMNQQLAWRNDLPVDATVLIRVTRRWKRWVVSNPNAIQFRDRWSWAIDADAEDPTIGGIFNSQCGSSGDIGTDSVAEPNPGKFWHWWGTNSSDEWVYLPVEHDQELRMWYKCFVWTPPQWVDNANHNQPYHLAEAGWARIQMIVYPQQGKLVRG